MAPGQGVEGNKDSMEVLASEWLSQLLKQQQKHIILIKNYSFEKNRVYLKKPFR